MNRTIFTAALLAAGGALGASGSAQATTVDLNISGLSDPQDIALIAGQPAQFNYGLDGVKQKSFFAPENGALVGQLTSTYTNPTTDTSYSPAEVKTGKFKISDAASGGIVPDVPAFGYQPTYDDAYANLKFVADGVSYIGTAHFAGDEATLETITFDPSGAPEPQAWALLIAGVGLAGAAMRRRAQPAATAA